MGIDYNNDKYMEYGPMSLGTIYNKDYKKHDMKGYFKKENRTQSEALSNKLPKIDEQPNNKNKNQDKNNGD